MRVISKSGKYDIPYELSVFWRDETVIWVNIPSLGKIIMAQYSSQEKAENAMQKLHDRYEYIWECTNGFDVYHKIDTIVFRFPQDDEL